MYVFSYLSWHPIKKKKKVFVFLNKTAYSVTNIWLHDTIGFIADGLCVCVPAADTEDVCIVERLFSSSLVAIVSLKAPRKLKVCHFKKGTEICNYSYSNTILAVKLNRQVGRGERDHTSCLTHFCLKCITEAHKHKAADE